MRGVVGRAREDTSVVRAKFVPCLSTTAAASKPVALITARGSWEPSRGSMPGPYPSDRVHPASTVGPASTPTTSAHGAGVQDGSAGASYCRVSEFHDDTAPCTNGAKIECGL